LVPFIGTGVGNHVVRVERRQRLLVDSIKTFSFAKGRQRGGTITGRGVDEEMT
jgi:hypothetical protein